MSKEPKFELYKDKDYKFRWRLRGSDDETIASGGPYATGEACVEAIEEYHANAIAESGVRAAQEAKADYAWISKWARDELPHILLPIFRDGYIQANEVIKQKEDTWSKKTKKGFWYIVGIIFTAIVSGIVAYYVALAGFKG